MQHFIASYGYVAIFVLMVAESACIPVPSELIMTLGGALAAGAVPGSHLNLVGVIAAGVAGNVAGSYIAWAVGRYGGPPALRRWGGRIWLREHDLDRATAWFGRHGPKAVLIGRLLPVVRTFISLPAGVARMDAVRFGIYTTIGCIPWTAALAAVGYAVGARWQSVASGFHTPTYIIAAVLVVAIGVVVWRHLRASARAGAAQPSAPSPPERESPVVSATADRTARHSEDHENQADQQHDDADRPQDGDRGHEADDKKDQAQDDHEVSSCSSGPSTVPRSGE
jgi:membrane protein DedA with SNARE-associated domain